ncbi:molybdopterin-dependent oxidoreductase [Nocardioides kribbensis]|uniref:molybdopterin-dependent oxidoreductase n=1 Tax=Nocardioides kribbensis TaxID=305517 RepID=UPI001879D0FD|nr:molybdopterin-dependent oxidoreductase [Nocardioides kribbensis]
MSSSLRTRVGPTALWGMFGVLATLVGMAAGHLLASLTTPAASPVLAVGSRVIDATPTPMKEWAIRQFGSADKPILIGSVMVVVLLLSAVAGLLARKRFVYGAVMLVVLVAVAAFAALTSTGAKASDVVPSLVAAVAGVAALGWLHRVATRGSRSADAEAVPGATVRSDDPAPRGASRRGVLVATGVLALAAAVMGGAGRFITGLRTRPEDIELPTAADPAPALPTDLSEKYPGISSLRTSNADFYRVDTRLDTPILSADDWTLTIDGDVDQEVTLTFDDLLGMELIERDITMTCVSNSVGGKFVGAATWLGVRLTDVLERAGIEGTKADQILATDFDGMTISTPLEVAVDGRDTMLVVGMNGEPLPREHGFPVRMITPGLYGFVGSCKWLTRLTLTTYDDAQAYWTERDWDTDAPIKISTRIDTPNALDQLDKGENIVGGVAWAQQKGGVAKVQVQVDGGGWQDAELGPEVNNDYWRQWFYRWDAQDEGQHTISARCVDGDGNVQTAAQAQPFPGGSSGIHSLLVSVA